MASLAEQVEAGTVTLTWRTTQLSNVCKDPIGGCEGRHGESRTIDEWEAAGLPGTGWSACGGNCHCVLIPDIALDFDFSSIDKIDIKKALGAVPGVTDPIEAARIAANLRLLGDFMPGQRVRYNGRATPQLQGMVGIVRTDPRPDPSGGLVIDFELADPRFPEFASLHVWDFTELIPING